MDILSEEQKEEMKKRSDAMDILLDILGGEKSPDIDFRLLKMKKDLNNELQLLMMDEKWFTLEKEPKLALINLFQQGIDLIKEIKSKIEK